MGRFLRSLNPWSKPPAEPEASRLSAIQAVNDIGTLTRIVQAGGGRVATVAALQKQLAKVHKLPLPRQRLRKDQMLVLLGKVFVPGLARMSAEHAVKVWVELDRVLIQVRVQLVRPQHLRNLDQLVVVVISMKERLLRKTNARWLRRISF